MRGKKKESLKVEMRRSYASSSLWWMMVLTTHDSDCESAEGFELGRIAQVESLRPRVMLDA